MRTFWSRSRSSGRGTEGAHLWDAEGRAYLDLYAGFAVANVGYCHPRVTAAIREQAGLMTHCPSAAPAESPGRALRAAARDRAALLDPRAARGHGVAGERAGACAGPRRHRPQQRADLCGHVPGRTVGALRYAGKHAYREPLAAPDAHFLPFPDPFRRPWAGGGDPGQSGSGCSRTRSSTRPAASSRPPASSSNRFRGMAAS